MFRFRRQTFPPPAIRDPAFAATLQVVRMHIETICNDEAGLRPFPATNEKCRRLIEYDRPNRLIFQIGFGLKHHLSPQKAV
nr:hypothetical protein [uncultured Rhodopila sp.]